MHSQKQNAPVLGRDRHTRPVSCLQVIHAPNNRGRKTLTKSPGQKLAFLRFSNILPTASYY